MERIKVDFQDGLGILLEMKLGGVTKNVIW
jgi:hypothetical protein